MTMALAAGFAACTSEDVIETSYTNEGARTVLDNIEFTIGEVDSRFTLESGTGWGFDEGDAFGAALVDVMAKVPVGSRAIDKYFLQNAIQSNYQYVKGDGNSWTTPARLVEGNYVFYAPFNEKHLSRKPIEVITPIAQTLDVNDGVVDAYSPINNAVAEGNPFFLAYEFLPAVGQETSLSLDFYSIFAYPKVTIKNNKKDDVTLTKIVIKTDEKFPVKAPLNVGTANGIASNAAKGVVGNLFNADADAKKHGAWVAKNEDTKDNGLVGSTADVLGTVAANADVIVLDIPNELEIPAGESVSFNIVLPAMKYTGATVMAYINDEEGYVLDLNETMTFYPNKLYPEQEYKNDNTINQSKKGSLFTATIAKSDETEELASAFPILVATTAELETAVLEGNSELYVIPTSEEVEINEDVFEAMRKVKFQGMTVAGDIKIVGSNDATKPLVLNEEIKIEGLATVEGYVKTTELVELANVEVSKDATFTVAADDTKDYDVAVANITNYGTANIDDDNSATKVTNFGTLNINAEAYAGKIAEGYTEDANGNKTYYGTVNIEEENAIANTVLRSVWNFNEDTEIPANVTVYGTTTIASGVTVEGTKLTVNYGGVLNVNGTLYGAVELDGILDADAVTAGNQTIQAKLNLGSTSFLRHSFAAVSTMTDAVTGRKINLVNVEKGARFFSQTAPIAYVESVFKHVGNLGSDDDEALKVPAVCNTLVIDGNIIPEADLDLKTGLTQVDKITINGDIVMDGNSTVTIASDNLTINGDVELAASNGGKKLDLSGVDNWKVAEKLIMQNNAYLLMNTDLKTATLNDVDTENGMVLTAATGLQELYITGKFSSTKKIDWSAGHANRNLILKNAELLMADGIDMDLTGVKVHVEGDVEVNGKRVGTTGFFLFNHTTIYNNSSLTIGVGTRIGGGGANQAAFTSSNKTGYGKLTTGDVPGVVVNNGEVDGDIAYGDADNADATVKATAAWWSGNEAI